MSRLLDMNAWNHPNNPPNRGKETAHVDLPYVLVADTNLERAALCLESVKPFNVGVLVARDGEEAMRVMERFGPPMLLVLDLSLSRKDGFSVIEALRADDRARCDVIAWSAFRELREFAVHRLAGLNVRVLSATAAPSIVRGAIEKALQRHGEAAKNGAAMPTPTPEELHDLMTELTEKARQLAGTPGVAVYMRAPGATQFRASVTWTSDALIPHSPYHIPRVFGWIQETGEAVVLPDLTTQPLSDVPTTTLQDVVQGLVAVPVVGPQKQIVGTICVFDLKPLTLSDADVDALKALGRSVHFERASAAPPAEHATQPEDASGDPASFGAPPAPTAQAPVSLDFESTVASARPATEPTAPRQTADPATSRSTAEPVAFFEGDAPAPSQDAATPAPSGLTPLLDRTMGEFAAARELARARREQRQLSVVVFEVGSRGSQGSLASEALKDIRGVIGETLLKAIRQSDLPIRWSGHELLVVLPGLGSAEARSVAERVRAALQAGSSHRMSVSGGVAELLAEDTFGGVVSRARERVRVALEHGHNRVA